MFAPGLETFLCGCDLIGFENRALKGREKLVTEAVASPSCEGTGEIVSSKETDQRHELLFLSSDLNKAVLPALEH